jgi:phosphoribosyl-ATP pyrophosphohydrolase/phosphoribosyl-AMP cyclohydrolase/histidinol dehydrogenase
MTAEPKLLRRLSPEKIAAAGTAPIPRRILDDAAAIVERVRSVGEVALRDYASRLDSWSEDSPLFYGRDDLDRALETAPPETRTRLERIAGRIRRFAEGQLETLRPFETVVPGGTAGHEIAPVECAGCYAPGGRYPLPSSVLMTVVPARVAGVESVWVASPRPTAITLHAAALAGADGLLAAGGAQAIAALAGGVGPIPPSDVVVGPGNHWVTAAKLLLAGQIAIDLPAGPSELVVIGDATSDPETVAADLLAQAEHDTAARPFLLTTDDSLVEAVDAALVRQLETLPTAETAAAALANGGAVRCTDDADVARVANEIAPEHLQISVAEPDRFRPMLRHCGALFVGDGAAEVFGDYGAGPNHVLPTGGAARFSGGLSVFTFLRVRTWMRGSAGASDPELVDYTVWLARQERLEAHARAAERRK